MLQQRLGVGFRGENGFSASFQIDRRSELAELAERPPVDGGSIDFVDGVRSFALLQQAGTGPGVMGLSGCRLWLFNRFI